MSSRRGRGLSLPTRRPPWMSEYGQKTGTGKSMWEPNVDHPTPMEKADLINAGLRPRKICLFEYGEAFEFHDELLNAYPKLVSAGGYELLRTLPLPNNNRQLGVIPPQSGGYTGYTVQYLKNVVGSAKVYPSSTAEIMFGTCIGTCIRE